VTAELSADAFLVGAHGPQATLRYAVAAERAGLDGVWLAEHHFGAACEPKQRRSIGYSQTPSATVLAGHVLGRTERIAVGTAACVLSARHPVALGEEAALLDALAPGRFRLGVARGGPWAELEVFGTGLDRYRRGFAESLDLLLRWLSGAPKVGAAGEWFNFREVAVVPCPPRPTPVWVAATSPSTVDLAAARGLPLLLGVHEDQPAKAALLDRYAQTAAAHGHDPAAVPHGSAYLVHLGDPARLRPRLAAWLATTREYVRLDGSAPPRDPAGYADHLLRIHPVGEAAQYADRLAAVVESAATAGIRHLLLMMEAAGPDDTEHQLAALATRLSATLTS